MPFVNTTPAVPREHGTHVPLIRRVPLLQFAMHALDPSMPSVVNPVPHGEQADCPVELANVSAGHA